jgi:hypothetical protein
VRDYSEGHTVDVVLKDRRFIDCREESRQKVLALDRRRGGISQWRRGDRREGVPSCEDVQRRSLAAGTVAKQHHLALYDFLTPAQLHCDG